MKNEIAKRVNLINLQVFDFQRRDSEYLLSDEEAGIEETTMPTLLSNRSVAIFLLDIRSNKDPWPKDKKWWSSKMPNDREGDFLGSEQWQWLEGALQRSTATVNIIVQGLQVHADRYFDGNVVEDWSSFPAAQHRLYQAILKSNVSVPILVSGDVHMAELLRRDCRKITYSENDDNTTRILLEVTSSGMSHSWGTNVCSRPHGAPICHIPYFHSALKAGMHWAHNNHAWTDLVHLTETNHKSLSSQDENARGHVVDGAKLKYQYSLEYNFGEFEFDWDQRQITIRILGHDATKRPLLSTRWSFDLLSGHVPPVDTKLTQTEYDKKYQALTAHDATNDDWICLNYGREATFGMKVFGVISPVLISTTILIVPFIVPMILVTRFLNRPGVPGSVKEKLQ